MSNILNTIRMLDGRYHIIVLDTLTDSSGTRAKVEFVGPTFPLGYKEDDLRYKSDRMTIVDIGQLKQPTLAQAKLAVRAIGYDLRKHEDEFQLRPIGKKWDGSKTYFTDFLDDAIGTAYFEYRRGLAAIELYNEARTAERLSKVTLIQQTDSMILRRAAVVLDGVPASKRRTVKDLQNTAGRLRTLADEMDFNTTVDNNIAAGK
jgi:hypothetical protein